MEFAPEKYDVFMNFGGTDTRKNFADHLCLKLQEDGINVFMDDHSISLGEDIQRVLPAAIERSKIAIVIISEDYASGKDCLNELEYILKCKDTNELQVIPIFYKVDPSDVGSLSNSFQRIQQHHGTTMEKWKEALKRIADMKGVVVDDTSYEGKVVRSLVEKVEAHLKSTCEGNNESGGKEGVYYFF